MKNRSFGKNHITISEVGLGCWQLGADWGSVDDATANEIIRTSLNKGITFFDTADVYGNGRSEELLGNYFNGHTEDVFIATKLGRSSELYPNKYTRNSVNQAIEASLTRLKVEALDLVQTHCIPTEVMRHGEIYEWLKDLKKEGKIKEFGASVETTDEALMLINNQPEVYSLQVIFNIFRQKPLFEVFELAKKNQVGIIARVPLASGLLTGKFTHDSKFPSDDHRNFNKDGKVFNVGETFAGLEYHYGVEMADEITRFVPDGLSMAQFALRWILDHETVSVVIPGATKVDQVLNNAAISELPSLSIETHKYLTKFYKDFVHQYIRGDY